MELLKVDEVKTESGAFFVESYMDGSYRIVHRGETVARFKDGQVMGIHLAMQLGRTYAESKGGREGASGEAVGRGPEAGVRADHSGGDAARGGAHATEEAGEDCDCELTGDAEDPEPTHYDRVCEFCGKTWRGLHCPHDGYQNPCPHCGQRPLRK